METQGPLEKEGNFQKRKLRKVKAKRNQVSQKEGQILTKALKNCSETPRIPHKVRDQPSQRSIWAWLRIIAKK